MSADQQAANGESEQGVNNSPNARLGLCTAIPRVTTLTKEVAMGPELIKKEKERDDLRKALDDNYTEEEIAEGKRRVFTDEERAEKQKEFEALEKEVATGKNCSRVSKNTYYAIAALSDKVMIEFIKSALLADTQGVAHKTLDTKYLLDDASRPPLDKRTDLTKLACYPFVSMLRTVYSYSQEAEDERKREETKINRQKREETDKRKRENGKAQPVRKRPVRVADKTNMLKSAGDCIDAATAHLTDEKKVRTGKICRQFLDRMMRDLIRSVASAAKAMLFKASTITPKLVMAAVEAIQRAYDRPESEIAEDRAFIQEKLDLAAEMEQESHARKEQRAKEALEAMSPEERAAHDKEEEKKKKEQLDKRAKDLETRAKELALKAKAMKEGK